MRLEGLIHAIPDQRGIDVDRNHLAQRQPGRHLVAFLVVQLDDLEHLALHGRPALADPRHIDQLARHRRKARKREFIDFMRHMRRGRVHLLRQIPGGEIPDEFAGLRHVTDGILGASRGKADDRRLVVEGVKEAVGREIDVAVLAAGRDPADRTRPDDGVERIVPQPVAVPGFVKMIVASAHECFASSQALAGKHDHARAKR